MFRRWITQTEDEELSIERGSESRTSPSLLERVERRSLTKQKRGKSVRMNNRMRCRKCGNEYAANEWISFHTNNIADETDWTGRSQSCVLRNGTGDRVWEVCIVPELLYQPGFPCLTGDMPRRKRTCKKNLWHN